MEPMHRCNPLATLMIAWDNTALMSLGNARIAHRAPTRQQERLAFHAQHALLMQLRAVLALATAAPATSPAHATVDTRGTESPATSPRPAHPRVPMEPVTRIMQVAA